MTMMRLIGYMTETLGVLNFLALAAYGVYLGRKHGFRLPPGRLRQMVRRVFCGRGRDRLRADWRVFPVSEHDPPSRLKTCDLCGAQQRLVTLPTQIRINNWPLGPFCIGPYCTPGCQGNLD